MDRSELDARRRNLAAELTRRGLDALIVSALPNVRYLTGFSGSNAMLIAWDAGCILFTDPRYELQASREAGCSVQVARGPLGPAVMRAARARRLRRLGFEKARLSYEAYELLSDQLPRGASFEPVAGLVETLRMVKSEFEVSLIQRSMLTASRAFQQAVKRVRPGMHESEVAADVDYQMRLLGADKPAFDTIVAAGERSALPHAQPSAHPLERNQLLLIDMGASRDGYASDMTRMAFFGTPGRKLKRLYGAVLEAQLAAVSAVREGVLAEQVDSQARRVLRAEKLDRAFVHSTGHGLGLEIHEAPRLGKREKTKLRSGMVVTVEPGVYLEGYGGIRIEDTVLVTRTGCEVLTPTSKELLLL